MKQSIHLTMVIFCLFSLIASAGGQAEYYFDKGFKAEEAGEYAEALTFYTLAIDANPNNEIYYIARGDLVSSLRVDNKTVSQKTNTTTFEKAERDYNKALQLQPDSYLAYMSRGTLFYNYHQFYKAKADFDEAVKEAIYVKDMVFARGARGSVKFKMNELDGALFDLEEALKLDATNSYVLNEMGFIYLSLGHYEKAREYYEKILSVQPNNINAQANVGFTYLKEEQYEMALDIYNKTIRQRPEKGFLYSNRALIYHHLGQTEEAMADINYSLKLYPANSYALYNRALIYLSIGEKNLACEDLFQAKELGYTLEYGHEVIDLLMVHCIEVNKKRLKGD